MTTLVKPALLARLRTSIPQVIDIWFEGVEAGAQSPGAAAMARWWGFQRSREENDRFNAQCREKFSAVLDDIKDLPAQSHAQQIAREMSEASTPLDKYHSVLGLVLLLDQMPRCIFPATNPLIYAHYDQIAQAVSQDAISKGLDAQANAKSMAWRLWFYMPLEHSESIEQHEQLARLLEEMKNDSPYYKNTSDFAARHHEIIEKFGRYPYRNEALGRQSTDSELEWIRQNGNPFATQ